MSDITYSVHKFDIKSNLNKIIESNILFDGKPVNCSSQKLNDYELKEFKKRLNLGVKICQA